MEIHWFTFWAQIVNFLILVALLKRFLYGPIRRAMSERERKIAERTEQAAQTQAEAERERETYAEKLRELEAAREQRLAELHEEVEVRRRELTRELRDEVEQVRHEWYATVEREKQSFLEELRERVGESVHAIAEHALTNLSNVPLQQQMIDVFLERLEHLPDGQRDEMRRAVRESGHDFIVETAFEPSSEDRDRIQRILKETLADDVSVAFHVSADLICGIQLKAAEYKVAWTIDEYLQSLEEEFTQALTDAIPTTVPVER